MTEIRKADLIELIDVDRHRALLDEDPRSLLTEEPPLHRPPRALGLAWARISRFTTLESLDDERNCSSA